MTRFGGGSTIVERPPYGAAVRPVPPVRLLSHDPDPASTAGSVPPVTEVATAKLPTDHGTFQIHVFESRLDDATHVALVCGDLGDGERVLARVHSSCVTGDIFHSSRCDCGQQLEMAMRRVAEEGRGVVLYLFQEGRGIGLANKIRAYALQEQGRDTVEANEQLGFDADERIYAPAATMLARMGIKRVRLMTNNPEKIAQLERYGIEVAERVAHSFPANGHNENYLRTKAERAGHLL